MTSELHRGDLGLRAVDVGANVLVAGTDYDVVFDRLIEADGFAGSSHPRRQAIYLNTGAAAVALAEATKDSDRSGD